MKDFFYYKPAMWVDGEKKIELLILKQEIMHYYLHIFIGEFALHVSVYLLDCLQDFLPPFFFSLKYWHAVLKICWDL